MFVVGIFLSISCSDSGQLQSDNSSSSEPSNVNMKDSVQTDTPQLILKFTATYQGDISYAHIYKCTPETIVEGALPAADFFMTVLFSDHASRDFLGDHLAPNVVEAGFKKIKENVTVPRMAITGFVDANGNAWEATFLR